MAELSRKRARKSKLVHRECDEEMEQEQPHSSTKPPIQFDIKVEIESCDEDDFTIPENPVKTEVKTELVNEHDMFEAEEHDIDEVARACSFIANEGTRDQIEPDKKVPIVSKIVFEDDDILDAEQDINTLASSLASNNVPGKRKRVPNKRKEFDYSLDDDDDDEEHDINALANMLGGVKRKDGKKRPSKTMKLDINKKAELWKRLACEEDEEFDETKPIKVEPESSPIKEDGPILSQIVSIAPVQIESEKLFNKKSRKSEPIFRPTNSSSKDNKIRQLKISEEEIMNELDRLSPVMTEEVDKILAIEMRNIWGRVRHVPHELGGQQKKLQVALDLWSRWCRACKNKEPPAMYKCYVCKQGWWSYSLFSEHLDTHVEEELNVEPEVFYQECFIVAYIYKTVPVYLPIEGNCWRCGRDLSFHSRNLFKKPGKSYGCVNCNDGFGNCRLMREHEGQCPKTLFKAAKECEVGDIQLNSCSICSFKVLDMAALDEHMMVFHAVRSDAPTAGGMVRSCGQCRGATAPHHTHACPKRPMSHACTYCARRHPGPQALAAHYRFTPDNVRCRICGEDLPKKCMEVKHMVKHSKHFGLMYKCTTCTENILMLDTHSMKQHKVIWHKQKYDRRRNYFDMVLVTKELIKRKGLESLDIVTSFSNVIFSESKQKGTLEILNFNSRNQISCRRESRGSSEDDDDVLIVDDGSQNPQIIELDDEDDVNVEIPAETDKNKEITATSPNENKKKSEDDDIVQETNDIIKIKKESSVEGIENSSAYENMLSKVFHTSTDGILEIQIKSEPADSEKTEDPFTEAGCSNDKKDLLKNGHMVYQCPKCEFTGLHHAMKAHLQTHTKEKGKSKKDLERYKCSQCVLSFPTIKDYSRHLSKHGYDLKTCPECMAPFSRFGVLEKHIKTRVRGMLVKMQYFVRRKEGEGAQLVINHQCRKCKENVSLNDSFSHWERHLEIRPLVDALTPKLEVSEGEGGEVRVRIDDPAAREPPRSPPRPGETRPLPPDLLKQIIAALLVHKGNKECMVCERVFDRQNDAKRHLIEHLLADAYLNKYKNKMLKCQICHDCFQRSDEYKLHMRTHGGLPVYQCSLCGKTFSDSSNFTKHKKIHNIDIYSCFICRAKFLAKRQLDKHIEMHTTSTPITCGLCGAECLSESRYNRHLRVVHDTRFYKYRCVICKKRFQTLKEMWDHSWLQHKERKSKADCPVCGQAYRKMTDLRIHVREMHNMDVKMLKELMDANLKSSALGELECPVCGLTYSSKELLMTHIKKEHGQTAKHVCKYCHKEQFADRRCLLRHMAAKHGYKQKRSRKILILRDVGTAVDKGAKSSVENTEVDVN